jgi:glycine oxidase
VTALRVGAETWTLGSIVLAAGWWTAELARALGVTLPLRPARGEMIEVALDSAGPPHVLEHGAVMVPRIGGRMGVGGLVEFDAAPEPTARGLAALLDRAAEVWPGVRSAPVVAHWAGVRPCSVLRHPIVDRVPGWENAYVATGHHRSGFLLAPLTAKVVAARLLGERLPVPEQAVRWA